MKKKTFYYLNYSPHSVSSYEMAFLLPPQVIPVTDLPKTPVTLALVIAHIRSKTATLIPLQSTLWLNISGELHEITHTTQKLTINFIYLCPITLNENENQYNPNLLDCGPACFHAALPALEINHTNWKDCYLSRLEAAEDGSQRSCS